MEDEIEADLSDVAVQTTRRASYDTLVESEKVDKSVALEILKLQHATETEHLNEMHSKQREADMLKHKIQILELERNLCETCDALNNDLEALNKKFDDLNERVTSNEEMLSQILQTIHFKKR